MKNQEYFDQNPESKPFLDRLVDEWRKHGKIIIGCDFDDTISPWKMERDFDAVIDLIKEAQKVGAYVVIFTASPVERYGYIKEYCLDQKNLEITTINETPLDLEFGRHGKIYANIFIDDRAGLIESLKILETATEIIANERS
jgi:hypothetical protein